MMKRLNDVFVQHDALLLCVLDSDQATWSSVRAGIIYAHWSLTLLGDTDRQAWKTREACRPGPRGGWGGGGVGVGGGGGGGRGWGGEESC